MKFSEETLTILKNFTTINPSIVLSPGNQIRTINPSKTVFAVAKINDEFPSKACIYDGSRFLSVYSMYENPDVQFEEKFCTITEGKRKTRYTFADENMVIIAPEKDVKIPSVDVEINVKNSDLQSVIKAAGILNLPEIAFVGEEGGCYLRAVDTSNPTADTFGVELGSTSDTFRLVIKVDNLKLLPMDYTVILCSKGLSCFENEKIKYFVAIESKSSTYKKG